MTNDSTISDKKTGASPFNQNNNLETRFSKSKQDRDSIISDVVYCHALNHSFDGGEPVDDWLIAKNEVDRMLYSRKETNSNTID